MLIASERNYRRRIIKLVETLWIALPSTKQKGGICRLIWRHFRLSQLEARRFKFSTDAARKFRDCPQGFMR
ncbi:hypothetical protein OBA45_00220 [bacterium]|nr:hypothetical protein [bacterium]